MTARRRRSDETPAATQPKLDTYNFYVETVNLAFDPKRVLLRRLIFIDEDRTKYVSVGFYPTRDY